MSSITSLGVGSGLDLESMLTKLMAVEQQPLTVLQKKVASYQSRISSLGTLKSALSSLQTAAAALKPSATQTAASKFVKYSASVADTTIATATTTTGAVAGTYNLSNIVLATAQQVRKSDFTIPGVAGTLSIQVGTAAAVNVDVAANASLSDISAAINNASTGISASVINDGDKDYLVLTANDTGNANTIKITSSNADWNDALGFSGTDGNKDWAQSAAAKNAKLTINGIDSISSASNTLTSISGVTVNLLKAGSTTVTVGKDTTSSLTSALNAFVTAYNSANTTMGSLGTYNASTKIAGPLQGDATLRTAKTQIRNLLFDTVAGGSSAYQRLSDIGISAATDGTLSIDSTKLNKAISADYAGVTNLVAKVGDAYNTTLDSIAGTSGTLISATNSTTSIIKSLTNRQTTLSARLTQIEANYRKQFSALDTLVASMNSTSSYLTQQLSALSRLTSGSNN